MIGSLLKSLQYNWLPMLLEFAYRTCGVQRKLLSLPVSKVTKTTCLTPCSRLGLHHTGVQNPTRSSMEYRLYNMENQCHLYGSLRAIMDIALKTTFHILAQQKKACQILLQQIKSAYNHVRLPMVVSITFWRKLLKVDKYRFLNPLKRRNK